MCLTNTNFHYMLNSRPPSNNSKFFIVGEKFDGNGFQEVCNICLTKYDSSQKNLRDDEDRFPHIFRTWR